jgi:glutathione S-transferase
VSRPDICLRYFDARGRAQFIRAWLTARGIDFQDERVPLDEGFASWQAMRDDRARVGPFRRLPVLHYGDELVPETIVIAGFLHRELGDAAALDARDNRRHDALLSICNSDLLVPIGMLLWAEMLMTGIDLPTFARTTLTRLCRTLDVVEEALTDWDWVAGLRRRPVTLADCFLWDELDKQRLVFGSRFSLATRPRLAAFYEQHPARKTFEDLLATRPCQLTGRPGEAAAIADIQGFVADAEAA